MIGASASIAALKASLGETIDVRLTRVKKSLVAAEQRQLKGTDTLVRAMIKVLTSVRRDATSIPEQLTIAADLRIRVDALDRRKPDYQEPEDEPKVPLTEREIYVQEQRAKIVPIAPVDDDYEPNFIDPVAAIYRVCQRYESKPRWTPQENEKILQVALGEIPLDAHSAVQLWLALQYDFKNRLKCVVSSMLPQSLWITAALCQFINTRHIFVPRAQCFENVTEEFAFRA